MTKNLNQTLRYWHNCVIISVILSGGTITMKLLKSKTLRILFISLVITVFSASTVLGAYVGQSYISSQGACVIDYDSGEVIYEYNGYSSRVPASMTKVMNLYCVYEAMSQGAFDMNTHVAISQNVYNKSRNPVYQTAPLYLNTTYTVGELIDMVVVYSDIGSAVALAELTAGSEWAFVQLMNQKSAELGLTAYFYDCFGVENNQASPVDIAKLVRAFIQKYPEILLHTSKRTTMLHGATYYTTNHLLDTHYYMGADGFKTGTTSAAGCCFAATAARDGRRMIAVTMGSISSSQRFADVKALMDYGFSYVKTNYDTVYHTDSSVRINGTEVPTFAHRGKCTIIAENLASYGFDTSFDPDARVLYIEYNKNKATSPIDTHVYKGKEGKAAYVTVPSDIKLAIKKDGNIHYIDQAYNIGGMMCFPVDSINMIYDTVWNQDTRTADVTIN